PARMAAIALGSFGVLALILAAVGIYGVMSHVVAGRTREIGLRMALGAQLSDVQKLILKQGMLLAAIGSACGLVIAFGGARMMKSTRLNSSHLVISYAVFCLKKKKKQKFQTSSTHYTLLTSFHRRH